MARKFNSKDKFKKDFVSELRDFANEILSARPEENIDVLDEIENLKKMIYGYELLFEEVKGGGNA